MSKEESASRYDDPLFLAVNDLATKEELLRDIEKDGLYNVLNAALYAHNQERVDLMKAAIKRGLSSVALSEQMRIPSGMALVCATCRFYPTEEHVKACSSGDACPHKWGGKSMFERAMEIYPDRPEHHEARAADRRDNPTRLKP